MSFKVSLSGWRISPLCDRAHRASIGGQHANLPDSVIESAPSQF